MSHRQTLKLLEYSTGFTLPYSFKAALAPIFHHRSLENQHVMLFGKRVWGCLSVQLSQSQLHIIDEPGVTGTGGKGNVRSRQNMGISEPGVSPTLMYKQPSLTTAELGRLPTCYTLVFISAWVLPFTTTISDLGFRSAVTLLVGFHLRGLTCSSNTLFVAIVSRVRLHLHTIFLQVL